METQCFLYNEYDFGQKIIQKKFKRCILGEKHEIFKRKFTKR